MEHQPQPKPQQEPQTKEPFEVKLFRKELELRREQAKEMILQTIEPFEVEDLGIAMLKLVRTYFYATVAVHLGMPLTETHKRLIDAVERIHPHNSEASPEPESSSHSSNPI